MGARQTLEKHEHDRRPVQEVAHLLAKGTTGLNKSWDSLQKYMMQTGEMHNNARMGWGSQVVRWTAGGPQSALDALLLLNNTFALDGHSPCSYGGLLGCLGLFSGPSAEKSIFGTVGDKYPKGKYVEVLSTVGLLEEASRNQRPGHLIQRMLAGPRTTGVPSVSAAQATAADSAVSGRFVALKLPPQTGEVINVSSDTEDLAVHKAVKDSETGVKPEPKRRRWKNRI